MSAPRCNERQVYGFQRVEDTPPRLVGRRSMAGGVGLRRAALRRRPAAQADLELGHEGLIRRHRLADMYDSPGAVCCIVLPGRDSLGETWLRVNPPIMFAQRPHATAVDEQQVGWRATVSALNEGTVVGAVVRRSETMREPWR